MNYQGTQLLPYPAQQVWQALLDPAVLQQCIAGCEQFEQVGDNGYKSVVKISIGPVSARFTSTVTLADVVPPLHCTLQFAGQGGVAGFGKGEARVSLAPQGQGQTATQLDWQADAHVGGRLAQIGSRLIEATVRKMSEDFFVRFAAQLQSSVPQSEVVAVADGPAQAVPAAAPQRAHAGARVWMAGAAVLLVAALAWWLSRQR